MRICYIQHVPHEGPARIRLWAEQRGHALRAVAAYRGEALPEPAEFDLLVLLGGPMSVNDEACYPWLGPEKQLVQQCVREQRAVFGVCLGAQLIASAQGARVGPAAHQEIGWYPVRRSDQTCRSDSLFAELPSSFVPLHWHGETFDLPPGAVRLAESDACRNQALQLGPRVLGVQFHLEATPESVLELLEAASGIARGPYVQSATQIAGEARVRTEATRSLLEQLLDRMVASA